jgi:hypothetical protein
VRRAASVSSCGRTCHVLPSFGSLLMRMRLLYPFRVYHAEMIDPEDLRRALAARKTVRISLDAMRPQVWLLFLVTPPTTLWVLFGGFAAQILGGVVVSAQILFFLVTYWKWMLKDPTRLGTVITFFPEKTASK